MAGYDEPGDRIKLTRSVARHYGKKYGALVSSGTAAIELALHHVGITQGHKILVPDNCCHNVVAAVIRSGAEPILLPVSRAMVLTPERVAQALPLGIAAIIAIHEYGLPCDISGIRESIGPDIPIIEDAAQAWKIKVRGKALGVASDVAVTSFAEGKPVSIGEGGAVFSDRPEIEQAIDRWSPGQRLRPLPAFPFAMSRYALPHLPEALIRADGLMEQRRKFVDWAIPMLKAAGFEPWQPALADEPCWNYLPVWCQSEATAESCVNSPYADKLGLTRPHRVALKDIPMLRDRGMAMPNQPGDVSYRQCVLVSCDGYPELETDFRIWLQDMSGRMFDLELINARQVD